MRRASVLAVLAYILGSCSKNDDEARLRAEREKTARAPAAAMPETASMATFVADGLLNECDDFAITHSQGAADKADVGTDLIDGIMRGF